MSRPDIPVTISGDPSGFEAALSRIRNLTGTTANDVMASFARIKMAAAGPAAVVAAGAGILIAATEAARETADAVAEIGVQAKMAGLSSKAFQEWKYVAEQARIPVDAITDGLKELSLRADEFAVTGKGSAAEAFQRLGLTQQEVKEKLKDPSELLLLLIERTRQLGGTAAGIRIFDELLGGTGGERMVTLIEQGEAGIRDQIKAANDLGIVIDEDLIKKAAEIDRLFNVVATTVGTALKSAIVSAADSLWEFIEGFREFQNQRSATLEKTQADIGKKRLELENERLQISGGESSSWLYRNPNGPLAKGRILEIDQELAKLQAQDAEVAKIINDRTTAMNRTAERTWTPPPPGSGSGKSKSKGGGGARENEYAREIAQIRKRTEALQAETAVQAGVNPLIEDYGFAMEYARARQELLTAAQKAGVAVTPELAEEVNGLALAYANSVVASEQLAEKQDEIRRRAEEALSAAKDVFRGVIDDAIAGAKATDILNNALKRIGDTLISDVLDSIFSIKNATGGSGGGLLGNLFGTLFGGGGGASLASLVPGLFAKGGAFDSIGLTPFAKGGAFTNSIVDRPTAFAFAKGAGLMGEAGAEAIMPLSRDSSGRLGVALQGGGAQAQPVHVTSDVRVSIDRDGNLQAFVEKTAVNVSGRTMTSAMQQFDKALPGRIADIMERNG